MRMTLLVLAAVFLAGLGLAPARAATKPKHGFLERTYRAPDGKEYKYVLFVPEAYPDKKSWPLIVFLHGSGEAGTDPQRAVRVGIGPEVRKREKTFPFLVLFPQARDPSWSAAADHQRTIAILDEVEKAYRVDPKRVYLTGLSSGGDGTWSLAVEYPDRWAAIVPICGEHDPADAPRIKNIPCWYFMGGADSPGDVKTAHAMVEALRALGAPIKYTEYPGQGHYIWGQTYSNPELYEWLLKQHR